MPCTWYCAVQIPWDDLTCSLYSCGSGRTIRAVWRNGGSASLIRICSPSSVWLIIPRKNALTVENDRNVISHYELWIMNIIESYHIPSPTGIGKQTIHVFVFACFVCCPGKHCPEILIVHFFQYFKDVQIEMAAARTCPWVQSSPIWALTTSIPSRKMM